MNLSKFKAANPEYADVPDNVLADAINAKYNSETLNLSTFKKDNPDYAGVADDVLADALYSKYYKDIFPKDEYLYIAGVAPKKPSVLDDISQFAGTVYEGAKDAVTGLFKDSVMDSLPKTNLETTGTTTPGLAPLRKDFVDTATQAVRELPLAKQKALANSGGQLGKVAATVAPQSEDYAARLSQGDLIPRTPAEASDAVLYEGRNPLLKPKSFTSYYNPDVILGKLYNAYYSNGTPEEKAAYDRNIEAYRERLAQIPWSDTLKGAATGAVDIVGGIPGFVTGALGGAAVAGLSGDLPTGMRFFHHVSSTLTPSNLLSKIGADLPVDSPSYKIAMLPFDVLNKAVETGASGYGALAKAAGASNATVDQIKAGVALGLFVGMASGAGGTKLGERLADKREQKNTTAIDSITQPIATIGETRSVDAAISAALTETTAKKTPAEQMAEIRPFVEQPRATETVVPETVVPQAVVPEAVVPEAVVPEAVVPEAVVPEAAGFTGVDRRVDANTRRKVADMSSDELKQALLTDSLTGLGNRRAYEESAKKPIQASIDVDSLKWVNDNLGHEAGDQLISAVAQALREQTPEAFRLGGDEFVAHFDSVDAANTALTRARERLGDAIFTYEMPDGTVISKKGAELSYGIAETLSQADTALRAEKQAREDAGLRAKRGEEPPGVVRNPTAGRETVGVPPTEIEGEHFIGYVGKNIGNRQRITLSRALDGNYNVLADGVPHYDFETGVATELRGPLDNAKLFVKEKTKDMFGPGRKFYKPAKAEAPPLISDVARLQESNNRQLEPLGRATKLVEVFYDELPSERVGETISKREAIILEKAAQLFDKKVILFRGDNFDGAVLSDNPRKIYINAEARSADPLVVFGHELAHQMQKDAPTVFNALRETLAAQIKEGGLTDFYRYYNKAKDVPAQDIARVLENPEVRDRLTSEFIADLTGNRLGESETWSRILDSVPDKSIAYRVVQFVKQFVDKILRNADFKKFATDKMVNDLNAVKEAARAALVEYAARNQVDRATIERSKLRADKENTLEKSEGRETESRARARTIALDYLKRISEPAIKFKNDIVLGLNPMSLGSDVSRAAATKFIREERRSQYQWKVFDDILVRSFTEAQLKKMWEAGDKENDLRREGRTSETEGLNSLTPEEREVVERMSKYGQEQHDAAIAEELIEDSGKVHFWMPRKAVIVNADGSFSTPKQSGSAGGVASTGRNLTTSAGSLKQRKYDTSAETESAMKKRFAQEGKEVELVRNIRVMPMEIARMERAIAGRRFINDLKTKGDANGLPVVEDGAALKGDPDYFTMDHPAFFTRKRITDRNGNTILAQVPLRVSKQFEGPLKAVLTEAPNAAYSAYMTLKAKSMGLIMFSPLMHLAVIWGKAMPAFDAKGKLTLGVHTMLVGNKAKNTPAIMVDAIDHGLVPIGGRGVYMDVTGVMDNPTLDVGKSWTAKLLAAPVALISERGATAVKKAVDAAGSLWHEKLLWDRVADIQMGLYVTMTDRLVSKGIALKDAKEVAASFSNLFAGVLPKEMMSESARRFFNFVLFSRMFTLGNIATIKAMATGLPKNVQSMIKLNSGELARKTANNEARRMAVGAFLTDIGLAYAANSLIQDWLTNKFDNGIADWAAGYKGRVGQLFARESPTHMLMHPLKSIRSITSSGQNEPGKEARVLAGQREDGTNVYIRAPIGKVGEEFDKYTDFPGGTFEQLRAKLSPTAKALLGIFNNDRGFGRQVYDTSEGAEVLPNAWRLAKYLVMSHLPEAEIDAVADLLAGSEDELAVKRALGPIVGLTISEGAPGGPDIGVVRTAARERSDKITSAMPEVKRALRRGDEDAAAALMEEAGMTPKEINSTIATFENPRRRLSKASLKKFRQTATDEQISRFESLRE